MLATGCGGCVSPNELMSDSPAFPFSIALATHIVAGTLALVAGPVAMIVGKGSRGHRRAGLIYFWAMAVVAITAIVLSVMRSGWFLLLVGIFSFYLAFTGLRAVRNKLPQKQAAAPDWIAAVLMLLASVGLVIWALVGASPGFRPVAWTFGGIGGFFAVQDVTRFLRQSGDPMAWWFEHMVRMLAAYIATFTAFAVVNLSFLPRMIPWLVPTLVGTIGIIVWTRHYRVRFASRSKAADSLSGRTAP